MASWTAMPAIQFSVKLNKQINFGMITIIEICIYDNMQRQNINIRISNTEYHSVSQSWKCVCWWFDVSIESIIVIYLSSSINGTVAASVATKCCKVCIFRLALSVCHKWFASVLHFAKAFPPQSKIRSKNQRWNCHYSQLDDKIIKTKLKLTNKYMTNSWS